MARSRFLVASACFLLTVCYSKLFAQANAGTILGRVTDSSGAVVPGVRIAVTNEQTGATKEYTSDSSGNYVLSYLIPGTYDVAAERVSFKRSVRRCPLVLLMRRSPGSASTANSLEAPLYRPNRLQRWCSTSLSLDVHRSIRSKYSLE